MRVLIAHWSRGRDPVEDHPDFIYWNDGTMGNIQDFARHSVDTHRLDHDERGWVMRMYPEIIAKVWYDDDARSWVVGSEWMQTESLELSDPHASDRQIREYLYAMPTIYKAEIVREPA